MEKVLLLQTDDIQFIEKLAARVAEKLKDSIMPTLPEVPAEKIYLSRKAAADKLEISPPTLDKYVKEGLIEKLGSKKRCRFRSEDVNNLYENLNKINRRSRYKELKKEKS